MHDRRAVLADGLPDARGNVVDDETDAVTVGVIRLRAVNDARHVIAVAAAEAPSPLLHRMAQIYRRKIGYAALNGDDVTRAEAASILRSLIDVIVLVPEGGELKIELRGALADILNVAATFHLVRSPQLGRDCGIEVDDGRCMRPRRY